MQRASRPNVLLVIFDSLSATALNRLSLSLPTLSALQQTSVSFTRAYACSPQSGPARASLFTGLDMAVHGVWTDGVTLPKRETTVAETFGRNGYSTWLVGRRQLAGVSNWTTEHARPDEYQHFDWAHGPLHRSRQNAYLTWLREIAPEVYSRVFPSQANPDETAIPDWQRHAMADLPDDLSFNTWLGNRVCERLTEQSRTQPFLGVVGFVVGKTMGAQEFDAPCTEHLDERALEQADVALAPILASVPDNTIIVVSSGRGAASEAPTQDAAINVPLFIGAPGHDAQRIATPVSTIDVATTIYKAAQITPPQRLQGTCLLGEPARGWAMSRLRCPETPHHTVLCTERFKLIMSLASPETFERPAYRLFDLETDPNEAHNLALDPAHVQDLDDMIDLMIDARVALEDRTEPRTAMF